MRDLIIIFIGVVVISQFWIFVFIDINHEVMQLKEYCVEETGRVSISHAWYGTTITTICQPK